MKSDPKRLDDGRPRSYPGMGASFTPGPKATASLLVSSKASAPKP